MDNNQNPSKLIHSDVTEQVIGAFYEVYNDLGHGFLESVYENALTLALQASELSVKRQVPITVWYRGAHCGEFRADIVVNDVVLVELKAAKAIEFAFEKQILNYLRATNIEVGLVLNFRPSAQFRRLVLENHRKGFLQAKGASH
jgi:GxxExxY protein